MFVILNKQNTYNKVWNTPHKNNSMLIWVPAGLFAIVNEASSLAILKQKFAYNRFLTKNKATK